MKSVSVHANSMVFNTKGLLIRGQSGSGKSDLSLRLLDIGGTLISDDYTFLTLETDNDTPCLYASCPNNDLQGFIEVRGVGIVKQPFIHKHKIDFIIDLSPIYPRMPNPTYCHDYGIPIQIFTLNPFELSVIQKIKILTDTDN